MGSEMCIRDRFGLVDDQVLDIVDVFDEVDATRARLRAPLPHRAFHFGVAGVADEDHVAAGAALARDFQVHLGDERARGIEDLQPAARRFLADRLRDAVRGEDHRRVVGDLVEFFDEHRAAMLEVVDQPEHCSYTTQTTLSVDDTRSIIQALRTRFPAIQGPKNDDICYATQNRQDAVRELTRECDLVLVVGSPNSSNSNRLRELAEREGIEAHLIDGASEIDPRWVLGRRHIGVTAGASAPDVLVRGVIDRLRELGARGVRELDGKPEDMVFALPKELRLTLVE